MWLFRIAAQSCTLVCVREKGGLLFLPNQLLGKFPANIWILRNINCDGSSFCYSVWIWQVLSAGGMYLGCSSAMQTHSWKIQKIETKQNKSPLLESVMAYMGDYCCKSCVWWWNPWINSEMDALYWSQASPGHLHHQDHERFESSLPMAALVRSGWQPQVSLFSLSNTCTPPDSQPSAAGKASGGQQRTITPGGILVHPLPPVNLDWVQGMEVLMTLK